MNMVKIKKDQHGFGALVVVVIIFVMAVVGGTGYMVYRNHTKSDDKAQNQSTISTTAPAGQPKNQPSDKLELTADQKLIVDLLAKTCGSGSETQLGKLASDEQKFVVKGYYARVNVKCNEQSFVSYLQKNDAGQWSVIENTQQAPSCKDFDNSVGLSRDIVNECYDETTMTMREVQ